MRIQLPDGRRAREPLPAPGADRVLCPPPGQSTVSTPTEEAEADLPAPGLRPIFQVYLDAGPGVRIKPEEVAQRIGCDDNQHFRRKFCRLSGDGWLSSTHHDGYFLPEN